MATMQTFVSVGKTKQWVEISKGRDVFAKADEKGLPIRVLHPNGNFKVIKNGGALPKSEPTTSTVVKQ